MRLFLISIITCLFLNIYGQENKVQVLIDEGISLHDQGKYKEAIEKYGQAYKLDTTSLMALYEMSFSYLALKDYEETERLCKEAINKFPDSKLLKQVYANYANCLDQKGEPLKAIEIYKVGLGKFPDYYSLWFNKGITEYNLENHYDAINSFQKSIKLHPSHPSSWYYLGVVENNIGNRISAILALSRFLIIENKGARTEKISPFLVRKVNNLYYQKKNGKSTSIYSSAKSRIDTVPDIFSEIETNLSMLETTSSIPGIGEEYKTEIEEFNSHMKTIFELLKAYKKDNNGFYWEFAAPFFIELESKDFVSTFVYDIYYNVATEKKEIKWLEKNKGNYKSYVDWINDYKWE
jgi:tetratricopeptide (TPR) repeat protein